MSAEHGGHGSGGEIFFIQGAFEPSADMWNSLFDIFTLFIFGFLAMLDTPVKSAATGGHH